MIFGLGNYQNCCISRLKGTVVFRKISNIRKNVRFSLKEERKNE